MLNIRHAYLAPYLSLIHLCPTVAAAAAPDTPSNTPLNWWTNWYSSLLTRSSATIVTNDIQQASRDEFIKQVFCLTNFVSRCLFRVRVKVREGVGGGFRWGLGFIHHNPDMLKLKLCLSVETLKKKYSNHFLKKIPSRPSTLQVGRSIDKLGRPNLWAGAVIYDAKLPVKTNRAKCDWRTYQGTDQLTSCHTNWQT